MVVTWVGYCCFKGNVKYFENYKADDSDYEKEKLNYYNRTNELTQLVCCNVIVTLLQLCTFVVSSCNNWIVMHGMENATKLTYWVFVASLYIEEMTVEEDEKSYSGEKFQNFVLAASADRQLCLTLHYSELHVSVYGLCSCFSFYLKQLKL
jgi:hypothetical protein